MMAPVYKIWKGYPQMASPQKKNSQVALNLLFPFSLFRYLPYLKRAAKTLCGWHFPILTLSNSDTFQFWHFLILKKNAFWHFPILKKNAFWHFPILTLSNFEEKCILTLSNSDTSQSLVFSPFHFSSFLYFLSFSCSLSLILSFTEYI